MKSAKFILLIISAISFCMSSGCEYNSASHIKGNKDRITESRVLDNFENIDITGNFNIILVQDNQHKLTLNCSSNISDYIMSEVQSNTLFISTPENIVIKEDKTVNLTIHFKDLQDFTSKGRIELKTSKVLTCNQLNFKCIGTSKLNLMVHANQVDFNLPGASSIDITGNAGEIHLISSGAFRYDAYNCDVNNYHMVMNGAGNAKVKVNQSLKVQINGAGNLLYKGSPNKVISNIGGIGKVKRLE